METLELPNQVIDSEWKDDIDYETYKDEGTYISPESVNKETIKRIKQSPVKLAISNMVNLKKIANQLTA